MLCGSLLCGLSLLLLLLFKLCLLCGKDRGGALLLFLHDRSCGLYLRCGCGLLRIVIKLRTASVTSEALSLFVKAVTSFCKRIE